MIDRHKMRKSRKIVLSIWLVIFVSVLTLTQAQTSSTTGLPSPPRPEAFEAYGFAGVIFSAFFFLVCAVFWIGYKAFSTRDAVWVAAQDKRDTAYQKTLETLASSHEKVADKIALTVHQQGESVARVNQQVVDSFKDLQREVQASHKTFSEETVAGIFRRALRDVQNEKHEKI